jgi:hypothetical protein
MQKQMSEFRKASLKQDSTFPHLHLEKHSLVPRPSPYQWQHDPFFSAGEFRKAQQVSDRKQTPSGNLRSEEEW